MKVLIVYGSAKILTNVLTFRDCALHQWNVRYAFCTRARSSNEAKISIDAARLAYPESKYESHFLLLPLAVPSAEFDPEYQCVGRVMSVRFEMLCISTATWVLTWISTHVCCSLLYCRLN